MDNTTQNDVIFQMQNCLDSLKKYENLREQVHLADQERFGRHTEKLSQIINQLSFFNEAEAGYDETMEEPTVFEVVKNRRKSKQKGQREQNLKEEISRDVLEEQLIATYGAATIKVCWMKSVGSFTLNPATGLLKSIS